MGTSQHFGIVGNGQQLVLELGTDGVMRHVQSWNTANAIYDCVWSEENDSLLLSACGDGTIKLWNTKVAEQPIRSFEEHHAEVHSVDWNIQVSVRYSAAHPKE